MAREEGGRARLGEKRKLSVCAKVIQTAAPCGLLHTSLHTGRLQQVVELLLLTSRVSEYHSDHKNKSYFLTISESS